MVSILLCESNHFLPVWALLSFTLHWVFVVAIVSLFNLKDNCTIIKKAAGNVS